MKSLINFSLEYIVKLNKWQINEGKFEIMFGGRLIEKNFKWYIFF